MKMLKIQSLGRGWHDRDEVLLHVAFQVLVDFIETERPDTVVDWNADRLHKRAWKEILSLYTWWTKTRPARQSPLANKKLAVPPLKFQKIPNSKFYHTLEPGRKKYAGYFKALKAQIRLEQDGLTKIRAIFTGSSTSEPSSGLECWKQAAGRAAHADSCLRGGRTSVWASQRRPCCDACADGRTRKRVIDSLDQPAYAGGIPEVAAMLVNGRGRLNWKRLAEYVIRYRSHGLIQRLGYLADALELKLDSGTRKTLSANIGKSITYLGAPGQWKKGGQYDAVWQIMDNIPRRELLAEIEVR